MWVGDNMFWSGSRNLTTDGGNCENVFLSVVFRPHTILTSQAEEHRDSVKNPESLSSDVFVWDSIQYCCVWIHSIKSLSGMWQLFIGKPNVRWDGRGDPAIQNQRISLALLAGSHWECWYAPHVWSLIGEMIRPWSWLILCSICMLKYGREGQQKVHAVIHG